ncbi:hypothetical protein AB0K16_56300 [Nonomuraea jabiensis]
MDQPPPYHGPSTSALYTMAGSGSSIRMTRPPMDYNGHFGENTGVLSLP